MGVFVLVYFVWVHAFVDMKSCACVGRYKI